MTETPATCPAPSLQVIVAVITYQRPVPLARLLGLLSTQRTAEGGRPVVLVVDNDPDGSGSAVAAAATGLDVRYLHEPRPGISAARNAALEAVPVGLLVFIDDDEEPCDGWLARLTGCFAHERLNGRLAGVVGPVVSRFDGSPDSFVAAGRFFDRRRLPTGATVAVAATNNLLLDRAVVAALRFDEAFGLTGGSDTLFTRRLTSAGHRLVWCDEAVVTDVVPQDRLTEGWVLRRARRSGNSWARCELLLGTGPLWWRRSGVAAAGGLRAAGGAALWLVGVATRSTPRRARGARTRERGRGMLEGALGRVVAEYRRPLAAGAQAEHR